MARTGRKSLIRTKPEKTMVFHQASTVCLPWISTRPLRPKHPDSGRRSLLRLTLCSPHRRHLGRPRWVPHRPHTKAHKYPTLVPCGAHMGPILVPPGLPHLGPRWGHATKPMWGPHGLPTWDPSGSHMGVLAGLCCVLRGTG